MIRASEAKGAALRPGRVTRLARQGRRVTGVTVDGATIEGDAVVIAMGPWSILAAQWLPLPAVYGLSPVLANAKVLAAQACYRQVTLDGLPLIGRVAGLDNAHVTTGHSVWGILNAPATGEAMTELILDGTRPAPSISRPSTHPAARA